MGYRLGNISGTPQLSDVPFSSMKDPSASVDPFVYTLKGRISPASSPTSLKRDCVQSPPREERFRTSLSSFRRKVPPEGLGRSPNAGDFRTKTPQRDWANSPPDASLYGDACRVSSPSFRRHVTPEGIFRSPSAMDFQGPIPRAIALGDSQSQPSLCVDALRMSTSSLNQAAPESVRSPPSSADWQGHALQPPGMPRSLGTSPSDPSLSVAIGSLPSRQATRPLPDCPESPKAVKLPALDQKGNMSMSSFGKYFGGAREKARNIWNSGKTRGSPEEAQTHVFEISPELDAIALNVFHSHASGTPEAIAFAQLPAALQALHAECKDFELSVSLFEKLQANFGSNTGVRLNFNEFLKLFKDGLPKACWQHIGSPQHKKGPGMGLPCSPTGSRKAKRGPSKRKLRQTIIKLLQNPDLEDIAQKIFETLSVSSDGCSQNPPELHDVLNTFNLKGIEQVIRSRFVNCDNSLDFVDFFVMLQSELRSYGLDSVNNECPLNIREFFALVR